MRPKLSIIKRLAGTAAVAAITVLALCQSGVCLAAVGAPAYLTTSALSFGTNSFGRTGLGTEVGSTLVATPIDTTNLAGRTITQVAAGGAHSLLLTDDGSVFSFGWNFSGLTGLGTDIGNTLVATPIDTTNLAGRTIKQVAAGGTHSLLLGDDGTVFSFGVSSFGQTGLGPGRGNTLVAKPIDTTNLAGKVITQVAAGHFHSLLLANDGTVYSFGANDLGQTGLGTSEGFTFVATPIDSSNFGPTRITQVAAGNFHSLLLAEDGTVYSFGMNADGQTGVGTPEYSILIPTPIDTTNLGGTKIKQVVAGAVHSLLLSDTGTVFSFGSNGLGRTGLGLDSGHALVATPIDTINLGERRITHLAAGGDHSLLLTDDGAVFSFGANSSGRTGQGIDDPFSRGTLVATPIYMSNLAGTRVVRVSAGAIHSLLLAVPEPSTACLLLVGASPLIVMLRARCRRATGN